MPNVKCRGCDAGWTAIPLFFRQVTDQLTRALAHLQEDVRDRLENGRNTVNRTTLPPLGTRHCYRLSIHEPEITTSTPAASVAPTT
ncbi:MAG: hypothetical protein ABIS29_02260 [Vicinamibacterales bacterium]